MNDPAKKIPANSNSILFVSFPGADIKDLFVHEQGQPDVPPPAPGRDEAFHNPPQPPKTNTKPTPREQPNKAQAQPQQSNAKPPQNQNQENLPKPSVNAVQPQRQKAEQNNPGRGRGGRAITQQQSETNANANILGFCAIIDLSGARATSFGLLISLVIPLIILLFNASSITNCESPSC